MPRLTLLRHLGASLFAAAILVLAAAPSTAAQTTTGTIRGYVRDSSGAPFGGAMVEAKNVDNGALRTTTSRDDGSYVLAGLVPGVYDLTVRHIGSAPSTRRVAVQIGATLLENFTPTSQAVEVAGVNIQGVAPSQETRTSEVATNVTPQQMSQLPTSSRNFLDLAALAPGVTVTPDFLGQTNKNFSAGAQGTGQINLFVDGASLKDNLTGGEGNSTGLAGQNNSRGNPFPRNAIQEYRVITQNFKAEYQNASSAIITSTTKSGGNTWTGDVFMTYQDKGLVALDSIARANNPTNDKSFKPNYTRYLFGGDVGGPLIRDKLFFFGSFEGNYQNRDATVTIDTAGTGAFPALSGYNLANANGNFLSPFREGLFFGKLTYNVGEHSSAELSVNDRHETDVKDFGGSNAFAGANNYRNDVFLGSLKYTYVTGPWLNEAMVTYQNFTRNPTPDTPGLVHQTFFLPSGQADLGSNVSSQNFVQKGVNLRNDLTYTGFHGMGDHVFKGGVNVSLLKFNIDKANNETPQFFYADGVNCNPTCDTVQEHYAYRNPYTMTWATGSPLLNANDAQIGAYLQDDWSPTSRLTLNLGIRWDYESNMFNTDYVTPQDVQDSIVKYNNTLQHPIDPATYFTNGTQRKRFYGAFQPRVGFSYALDHESKTTLFGGFGVYYDRTFFDMSVDERLKLSRPFYTIHFAHPDSVPTAGQVAWDNRYLTTNSAVLDTLVSTSQAAGREVWLIANNAKVPYSHQWNLGIRHFFGDVLVSVAYVGQRSYDGLVLNWANLAMNASGQCCVGGDFGHGFTNIIYSTNSVRTWYDAINVTLNRPYTRNIKGWGWGGGFSYTAGSRYVQGVDQVDDEFAFPQDQFIKKHPANDEKSRLVANWIVDVPYAWGLQFGGLLTLGTGPRVDIGSRFNGFSGVFIPGGFSPPQYPFIIPGAWAFRELDLRLTKEFPQWSGGRVAVTLDAYNVLNTANYTFDGNSGKPNGLASDPRKIQLGVDYSF